MAIAFRGSTSGTAIDGANVTLDLTAISGLAQDDLVIVAYAIGDNDDVDEDLVMVTSGYTQVADLFSNDTNDTNLGVFYKFMGATPDTTAEVDGMGGADAGVNAIAMAFSGVKLVADGGPFDTASTTATGIDTIHPDPPSIDHSGAAGIWTVIAGAGGYNGTAKTFTNPTGYTTNAVTSNVDDSSDVVLGMGYNSSPSDPEDPGVMTASGTDNAAFSWCAVTMALSPASAAASTAYAGMIPILS